MIRGEIAGDRCGACRRPLSDAPWVSREDVRFTSGEFSGEHGTVLIVNCSCGMTDVVPLDAWPTAS